MNALESLVENGVINLNSITLSEILPVRQIVS